MWDDWADPGIWAGTLNAFGVNILMSIDNAMVIALAGRALPGARQRTAILLAVLGIVVLRFALTLGVDMLADLPLFRIIGALLLGWIGVKLFAPVPEGLVLPQGTSIWAVLSVVLTADLALSLDNVLAVYAAAGGSWPQILVGLATSIPLVVFGSQIILKIIERFPVIITLGGALLGFVAGEMALDDTKTRPLLEARALHGNCQSLTAQADALRECLAHAVHNWQMIAGAAGAILVVAIGMWLARAAKRAEPAPVKETPLRK